MPVTVVAIPLMQNDPGAPAFPDSPRDTLYAQDWNLLREALTQGQKGIYTKGIKLGSEGLEILASAPVRLGSGTLITFLNAAQSDAQVGYISNDGELGMQRIRAGLKLFLSAGVEEVHEGLTTHTVPIGTTTNTHEVWTRGAVTVKDFEVDYRSGTLSVLHILTGHYAVDRDYAGVIFKNPSVRTILRMNVDGELEIADVDDWAARPLTFSNVRKVMTGTGVFVDSITGIDGVVADEVSANPKQYVLRLSGVQAPSLDIGLGPDQIGPDTLAAGGLVGSVAAFVTPAEKALIATHASQIAAIQAELLTTIKILHTAAGQDITPDANGRVLLANSSSVIFDRPGPNTLRAVASGGGGGGGGGGGSVNSVTAGPGLEDDGTSTDPNLRVNVGAGLSIVSDEVVPDWGTGANNVARGDHNHDAVYSPLGHTHSGFISSGGAYADLVASSKIGTGAGQVAAGDDARFHTQNSDLGTNSLTFILRRGFAGTPANGDIVGILAERGTQTDARIYFRETDDAWVAGLVGGEVPIVLDDDPRLSDARAPLLHDMMADHLGTLDAVRVVVTSFVPSSYVPTGPEVDGHLEGVDAAFTGKASQTDTRFGGQQFFGSCGAVALNTFLIGNPAEGDLCNASGIINYASINTESQLAPGSTFSLLIKNITQGTSETIVISAGQAYVRDPALGLAVAAGDEISVRVSAITGVPNCGTVVVRLSRT